MFKAFFGRSRQGYQLAPAVEFRDLKSGTSTPASRSSSEIVDETVLYVTRKPKTSWWSRSLLLTHLLLAAFNVAVLCTVFRTRGIHWKPLRNYHQRAVFEHSPLFDRLDIELKTVQFDGSVYNSPNSSIFRQPPSDAVDKAWLDISEVKMFLADRTDVVRAGIDPNVAVHVPNAWDMGEKYIVQLDGPHQLHCLDLLRRQAYAKHYYPEGNDKDAFYWAHMSHCLDSLRQALMCTSSVNILPLQFVEGEPGATFDFNAKHKCRDHYAMMRWVDENAIDWNKMGSIPMPDGYVPVPAEEEYYDYIPAYSETGHSVISHQLQTGSHHHR